MKKLPGALFIVDPRKERNAIAEARKLNIPIVAIVDTNCDPDEIDYIIPGNDDAIRAIRLISQAMAGAVQEGRQGVDADKTTARPKLPKQPGMIQKKFRQRRQNNDGIYSTGCQGSPRNDRRRHDGL